MKSKLSLAISTSLLASSLLASTAVQADIEANVALTSDYRYRGISQNDQTIAIQGGFDYGHESGFYAGIWSSSVDFQIQTVDDATAEVDIYAGYGGDFGDSGFGWDVGFLHYDYPNSDGSLNYNFTEVNGTLTYEWLTVFYAHTSDYFAGSGAADYISAAADFEFGDDWTAGASIARQAVEENDTWGTPDWYDYKIYVGKTFQGLDFELAFIDTDLSNSECFGGSDWCDSTVTITMAKTF
ncbi:MAG: hypothetical protein DRQ47_03145 [Gammaproteobacteria bacterium]|nr:MAG: hypothetical protein DRQ47_03145 [Gammaproteobacteria bacterium]